MALLNRKLKEKDVDNLPLIEESEKVVVDLDEDDENSEDTFVHHGITLWVSDALIMIVQHIQIFALILAMGERWGYPKTFVQHASYVFLFNLDVWEFVKVSSGAYTGTLNLDTFLPSGSIGIDYSYYLIGWTIGVAVIGCTFLITYAVFLHRKPLYLLLHVARMKRVFSVFIQLACLPVGTAYARVFHCRSDGIWNVENSVKCYSSDSIEHLVFVAIASLVVILVFLAYPINMIRKIRGQVICYSEEKHEGYLQLKEAEYNQGLDILWGVGQFHLFSSFRRLWIFYKPIMFILKFSLVCFYAMFLFFTESNRLTFGQRLLINLPIFMFFFLILFGLFSSGLARPPIKAFRAFTGWCCWKGISRLLHVLFNITPTWVVAKLFLVLLVGGLFTIDRLGGGIGATLSMLSLIMVRSLPFRVSAFNFMILFSLLVNAGNAYIGVMVEMYNTDELVNAFFVPPIPELILTWVNIAWLCVAVLWLVYLLLRYLHIILPKQPLWPMLSTDGKSNISEETKKYMRAVLRGRHTLEKALSSPPMFAPVHELERQIHIINAYCREAEFLDDPTFDSLWDLLDELIEAHRNLAPHSLFALSVKKTVREIAKELMVLMPQMRKRLDQREYDFILMDPMKKRMLLKMYVLGIFVNGRMDKVKHDVEQKVYMALKEAEKTKTPSSLYGSSTAYDWDSMIDLAGPYSTFDAMRTVSSSGSRPGTSFSVASKADSVDKLLDEVEDWEEGQEMAKRRKKISVGSMPLIEEHPSSPSGGQFLFLEQSFRTWYNQSKLS